MYIELTRLSSTQLQSTFHRSQLSIYPEKIARMRTFNDWHAPTQIFNRQQFNDRLVNEEKIKNKN